MSDDLTDFSTLLEALYGNLLAEAPWEAFLRALALHLDASIATLIITGSFGLTRESILSPGGDPRVTGEYVETYSALDPFVGLPEGEVTAFADFVQGSVRDSVFWRDFLAAAGGDQILGVDLRLEGAVEARLRAMRDASRTDFGPAERQRFQRLVPHLRHALLLYVRLHAARAEQGVYRAMVERMGVAAIILDAAGKVLRSNALADRLLEEADGFALVEGRLSLSGSAPRRALARLLQAVGAGPDAAVLPAQRFRVERPSGKRDLAAIAKLLSGPALLRSGAGAAVALFVGDTDHGGGLDPAVIRDIFQLTRVEAMLCAVLAEGCSLVEAADRLGVAHNTARSHLRSIFLKTGARRQSQLVHLLHASLPELPDTGADI